MQTRKKRVIRTYRKLIVPAMILALMFFTLATLGTVSQANSASGPRDKNRERDGQQAAVTQSDAAQPQEPASAEDIQPAGGISSADLGTGREEPQTVEFDDLTVTADTARIRTGAGADCELIGSAKKDEQYKVLSIEYAENGVPWYEVRLDGEQTGFICGNYISYTGKIAGGKVYLTFDDGPSENTAKILDILDEYGAKATFFVIYNPDLSDMYDEILRRGHMIGLHSYSHDYKTVYKSDTAYFNDLEMISEYVFEQTNFYATYIRFPGGSSNTVSRKYSKGIMTRLSEEVENRGFKYFDWNVSSGDADDNDLPAEKILSKTKSGSGNRVEITLLLHDAPAKTTTVEALPGIIEYYQSRGYQLCAINDDTVPAHHQIKN